MKALSAHTTHTDPYRAGAELAEGLNGVAPEVVFLFASIHYGGSPEIAEALLDGLDRDDVVLIGATGDGFFETELSAEVGASALALNSEGAVRWELASARGVSRSPRVAARACFGEIHGRLAGDEPKMAFVVSGLRTDGHLLLEAINELTSYPVFGGLAGDDRKMQASWTFANVEAFDDGLVVLTASGQLGFELHVACGLTPVGEPGRVTNATAQRVRTINGISAMRFIETQTGKPIAAIDKGITAFRLSDPRNRAESWHLSIANFDEADGSVTLFGSVETGQEILVCFAHPQTIIGAIEEIGRQMGRTHLDPVAGLIVSCAGRKWVLGHQIEQEAKAAMSGVARPFPIAGFPSFGEIAPLSHGACYTKGLFHNVTYVLALFGEN
jgi:hypothetical protein